MSKKMVKRISIKDIMNWVVVADLHCGCQLGLFNPYGNFLFDEGGSYKVNNVQKEIWKYWKEFWYEWVPTSTKGEPFGVILNGDTLDGSHHQATHQITHNLTDQKKIATEILLPIVDMCEGRLYMIRGTEAHVGKSGQEEEALAKSLGAIPNEYGQYARYDLWKKVGKSLVHILHHIGTTGSQAYESTAVHKELMDSYTEAARWHQRPPDIIVRSHRHRFLKTEIASDRGRAIAVVTPGWQGKTPFTWKIAGARLSVPQFGGILIRQGDQEFFTLNYTKTPERSRTV